MSHQPFEKWLFSEESLEPEQSESLNAHLDQCEDCREMSMAFDQVIDVISTSRSPDPAPGFTQRWYQHLSAYRQKRQQQRIWLIVLGVFAIATLILLALFFLNLTNFNWTYGLGQFIANFSLVAARGSQVLRAARSITSAFPILIPIMIVFGVGSLSAAAALTVTWFSSIIKLYQPVKEGVHLR
jgi:predicted anti-sigma-YlaC factor YlaD